MSSILIRATPRLQTTALNPVERTPILGLSIHNSFKITKTTKFPRSIPVLYLIPNTNQVSACYMTHEDEAIKLNSSGNVTANWIEKAILYTVLKTKYTSYQVNKGRYSFDFSKFDNSLIIVLIEYILTCKLDRINYSWVTPLQDLVLFSKVATKKTKAPLYKSQVSDPFENINIGERGSTNIGGKYTYANYKKFSYSHSYPISGIGIDDTTKEKIALSPTINRVTQGLVGLLDGMSYTDFKKATQDFNTPVNKE